MKHKKIKLLIILLSTFISCSDDREFEILEFLKPPGNGCKVKKIVLDPQSSELDITTYNYDELGRIISQHIQYTDTSYTTSYSYNDFNQLVKVVNYVGTDYSHYTEIIWNDNLPFESKTYENGQLVLQSHYTFNNNRLITLKQTFSTEYEVISRFSYSGNNFSSWYYGDKLIYKNVKYDLMKSPSLLLLSIDFMAGWNYSKNNAVQSVDFVNTPTGNSLNYKYTYNDKGYPLSIKIGNQITALFEYIDCN